MINQQYEKLLVGPALSDPPILRAISSPILAVPAVPEEPVVAASQYRLSLWRGLKSLKFQVCHIIIITFQVGLPSWMESYTNSDAPTDAPTSTEKLWH